MHNSILWSTQHTEDTLPLWNKETEGMSNGGPKELMLKANSQRELQTHIPRASPTTEVLPGQ